MKRNASSLRKRKALAHALPIANPASPTFVYAISWSPIPPSGSIP